STLFNRLAESAAALVSEVAGTTRDYLTADITINGMALRIVDTAGHDADARGIAADAQRRRQQQIDEADLVVWCQPADQAVLDAAPVAPPDRVLALLTKSDLAAGAAHDNRPAVAVSAKTGEGLYELTKAILTRLSNPTPGARQLVGSTAARSQDSL